jgi:hypothetical protein
MTKTKTQLIDATWHTGGIPMPVLHLILERLTKDWIKDFRNGNLGVAPRHPAFLIAHYKALRVSNRVKAVSPCGKALMLLKTQYAKKPKNPV